MVEKLFLLFFVEAHTVLRQLTGSRHIFRNNMAIDPSFNQASPEIFQVKKLDIQLTFSFAKKCSMSNLT